MKQRLRRLIDSIREGDEERVEEAIFQFSRERRVYAPLALAVGAFVMVFRGLRLLVTNWRLLLVQILPAMLIWVVSYDLKAHLLHGKEFQAIRGPVVLVLFAAVVLLTIAAFFLNAVFAFAISRPGVPDLAAGFQQARGHAAVVASWGAGTGLALAVATVLAPRWGLGIFTLLLGIVLGFMIVCYVAVPARIIGAQAAQAARPAKTAQSGRGKESGRSKVAAAAVSGLFGAVVCTPPYIVVRIGLVLLNKYTLTWLGVVLLVIGFTLEAGATGAVNAIKMSAKLLAGGSRNAPPGPEPQPLHQ